MIKKEVICDICNKKCNKLTDLLNLFEWSYGIKLTRYQKWILKCYEKYYTIKQKIIPR